ncbi:MAG TPA: hypothetical protein DCQ37_12175 [Desulfobacteraceae bacterium]|nr:hypothetical protein [Desulfobacteraceae bacterium]
MKKRFTSYLQGRITLMFLGLTFLIYGLISAYWIFGLQPRLRAEAESGAKVLAYAQSQTLAYVLSSLEGDFRRAKLQQAMDRILLLTNPNIEGTFILGVELEVDYDVIKSDKKDLDIRRGRIGCQDCFLTEIPLYSDNSRELMGIVRFHSNGDFFQRLKTDVKNKIYIGSAGMFLLIVLTWRLLFFLLKPLNMLADSLRRHEIETVMEPLPPLHGLVSEEIRLVKEALDVLFQKTNRYTEELQQTYNDLREAQTQLIQSAKLASIGELSAGVAHELNQPLMVIRTTIQLIVRYISKGHTDILQFKEQFEKIEKNTTRMMNIINHLRVFSRQSSTEFVPVNVSKVIEDAFMMISEQLRLRSIIVEKQLLPDIPSVHGDPNQLEQVFLNLITNARDAITAKSATDMHHLGKLEIITKISDDCESDIEILFKDNGCGIPQDIRDKIFDPFFTTKEVGQGTGLGLSISYGIIRDHQGSIHIVETSAAGTVFRVILPFSASNTETPLPRTLP